MVSTVEPLALGGEEAVMVGREKSENGREEMQPAMDRVAEEEVGLERGAIRGHNEEEEEDEEVSLESPNKRIRLSSAEDEAGPGDSQDGVSQVCIRKETITVLWNNNISSPVPQTSGARGEW